ncbi:MAG: DNA repair protein RecO, partial [Gemmatimonadales bacterium]
QSAIAKGALRPRSPFGASLESWSEGTAQLYHRETRELQTLAGFDVLDLRRGLARDLGRFAGAGALAEVMLRMAPAAPLTAAFDTYTRALDQLAAARPDQADAVAARWLWLLVGVLGFAPQLAVCVRDGKPVANGGGTGASSGVAFSTADGGVLCPACAKSLQPTRLPAGAYRDLLALNDPRADLPALDAAHAAAHRRLLARFVRHHLGETRLGAGPGTLRAMDFWERHAWVSSVLPPPPLPPSPASAASESAPPATSITARPRWCAR